MLRRERKEGRGEGRRGKKYFMPALAAASSSSFPLPFECRGGSGRVCSPPFVLLPSPPLFSFCSGLSSRNISPFFLFLFSVPSTLFAGEAERKEEKAISHFLGGASRSL